MLQPLNELRQRPIAVTIDMVETTHEDPEPSAQAGNRYPEHAKRLRRYAATAFVITATLLVSFSTTKLDTQENKIFKMALFTSIAAFFCEIGVLILCESVTKPDLNCFYRRFGEKLYILIYGWNSLMMLTAFFFLLLCTVRYAYLVFFLILALLVISVLLYQGSTLKHTESINYYREHDSELNQFSELSSAVVGILFAGLLSFVFSNPTLSGNKSKNHQIKVTECFLYVILIMSLLLMLLTSVPPAVRLPSTRARMVRVIKSLSYTLVSLLTLVGLMAASEVLQGPVVFSTIAHIMGATYWLVTELLYEHDDQGRVEPVSKIEFDSLSMCIAGVAFTTLMYVYSNNIDSSEPYSWWYFILLAVCMISLCSTFISCLSKMAIFSYALETRAWTKAEMILSSITYISLVVALLSTSLLVVYSSLF